MSVLTLKDRTRLWICDIFLLGIQVIAFLCMWWCMWSRTQRTWHVELTHWSLHWCRTSEIYWVSVEMDWIIKFLNFRKFRGHGHCDWWGWGGDGIVISPGKNTSWFGDPAKLSGSQEVFLVLLTLSSSITSLFLPSLLNSSSLAEVVCNFWLSEYNLSEACEERMGVYTLDCGALIFSAPGLSSNSFGIVIKSLHLAIFGISLLITGAKLWGSGSWLLAGAVLCTGSVVEDTLTTQIPPFQRLKKTHGMLIFYWNILWSWDQMRAYLMSIC